MTVFLSYSIKDFFFAELLEIKLAEAGITIWRDQGELIAGKDWRQGIEQGISNSLAIIVALSQNSSESSYVTFEWAYAIGKGKPVLPLKLAECNIHPKLEAIQYLDFSISRALPWESLIERIREIEEDNDQILSSNDTPVISINPDDTLVKSILAYLNQRGYQMASFDRIRKRIDENLTDQRLQKLIEDNKSIFRPAVLKDGQKGLAKLVP